VQRAGHLGFGLKSVWLKDILPDNPERNVLRFRRYLRSLGVHGIILPYLFQDAHAFCDWPECSVVCLQSHIYHLYAEGHYHPERQADIYHCVRADHFLNVQSSCFHLRNKGFRRIGFHMPHWQDERSGLRNRSAFLGMQADWPLEDRVPILFDPHPAEKVSDNFMRWLDEWKPDVLICGHSETIKWIEQTGRRVPQDISVVHLHLAADVAGWAGIDPRLEEIGGIAIDVLVAQLHRNDRGIPTSRRDIVLPGTWCSGRTLLPPA